MSKTVTIPLQVEKLMGQPDHLIFTQQFITILVVMTSVFSLLLLFLINLLNTSIQFKFSQDFFFLLLLSIFPFLFINPNHFSIIDTYL